MTMAHTEQPLTPIGADDFARRALPTTARRIICLANEKRPRTAPTVGGRTQEDQAPMPTRNPNRGHRGPRLGSKVAVGNGSGRRVTDGRA